MRSNVTGYVMDPLGGHWFDGVDIAIRFREFLGTYLEHCHTTQHEDHAMLLRWDIENPGQVKLMPTPLSRTRMILPSSRSWIVRRSCHYSI